jgi:hypothetical protein
MAKIALICQRGDSQAQMLVKSLREQGHNLLILTNPGETSFPAEIEVWQCLRSLRTTHFVRIAWQLTLRGVEVVHFLVPENHGSIPKTWILLASLFSILRKPKLVLSFSRMPILRRKVWPEQWMINLAAAVTAKSGRDLLQLKSIYHLRQQKTEILPDFLPLPQKDPEAVDIPGTKDLIDCLGNYVFCDSGADIFLNKANLITGLLSWVFTTPRPAQWPVQKFFFFEKLSKDKETVLIQNARALFLAFSDLDREDLERYFLIASLHRIPLLLNRSQANLIPDLVKPGENAWILSQGMSSLAELLQTNPSLEMNYRAVGNEVHKLNDSLVNSINRLYTKTLTI